MGNDGATQTTTPTAGPRRSGSEVHSAIVEPRTSQSSGVGDEELFLTPRVLDAGAFARFAETLKGIIAQASAQGRTLEDFSADAEAMIKRCSDTSDSVNKRLQAGIRMLKMIDERAERTDRLLEKVQRSLPDAQAMSERIDRVIDERLSASEARIDALISQAEQRAKTAEDRAQSAIERSRTHANELESLGETIDERLASLREVIEQSVSERETGAAAIQARVDETRAQINDAISQAFEKAQDAGAALTARADETMERIESRVQRVDHSIEPLIEASNRAMRALGMDPENPVFEDSPLSRIESLVDRGDTQLASLDRVYRQLEDLQSQAEGVRSAFGDWLLQAAGELDTLEERKGQIVGPMREAAESIRELGPDLASKLQMASTELTQLQFEQKTLRETIAASSTLANEVTDRMSNQSGQLQALLDGSLHKLSTRVEQAGVWLGTLIQRAESLGASMPGAGSMSFGDGDDPQPTAHQPTSTTQSQAPAPHTHPTAQEPVHRADDGPAHDPVEQEQEHEQARNYMVPRPPQLPIDAVSFDGAQGVIQHDQQDDNG